MADIQLIIQEPSERMGISLQPSILDDMLTIDLFEYPELWPTELAAVLDDYAEQDWFTYQQLDDLLTKCQAIGYTFEYGLDASPYNLQPLTI